MVSGKKTRYQLVNITYFSVQVDLGMSSFCIAAPTVSPRGSLKLAPATHPSMSNDFNSYIRCFLWLKFIIFTCPSNDTTLYYGHVQILSAHQQGPLSGTYDKNQVCCMYTTKMDYSREMPGIHINAYLCPSDYGI